MKIYVATKYECKEEARAAMKSLQEAGHTITHDWSKDNINSGDTSLERHTIQRRHAFDDLVGVAEADVLVVLAHDLAYGTMVELGYALALRHQSDQRGAAQPKPRIYVVDSWIRDTPFFHLDDVQCVPSVQWVVDDLKARER